MHIVLFVSAVHALMQVFSTARMWLGPADHEIECLQHGLGGKVCANVSNAVNGDFLKWRHNCESANTTLFFTAISIVGISVLITILLSGWAVFVIVTKRPTKLSHFKTWHLIDSIAESSLFVLGVIIFITRLRHYLVPSMKGGNYYGSQLCAAESDFSLTATRCGDDHSRIYVQMLIADGVNLPCMQFTTHGTHMTSAESSTGGARLVGACMRIDNFYRKPRKLDLAVAG